MDKSEFAASVFNKYAMQYQNKFMDVSAYASGFDFFCETLSEKNASLLELACGPGNVSKYLLTKRPDFKLMGTDLSPNMIELAKLNNPWAEFQLMDARNLSTLKKKYNGVVCGFCLPYLSMNETETLIHDAARILLPNGLLYLSTMEDDYSKSGNRKGSSGDEIFMHYYMSDDLTRILLKYKFELLKLDRVESKMTDGTKVTDLVIIAKTP